jgi:hypothetical protein
MHQKLDLSAYPNAGIHLENFLTLSLPCHTSHAARSLMALTVEAGR